jgi:hypothetical protein
LASNNGAYYIIQYSYFAQVAMSGE